MRATFFEGPLEVRPVGWVRKQDLLEYAPCWMTYATKPADENGRAAAALYSEDQLRYEKAQRPFVEAMLAACVPGGASCDPQHIADAIRAWAAENNRL